MNEAVNTKMVQQVIPEGYLPNSKGHLVPIAAIEPVDMTRHELVSELIDKARDLQQQMLDFKLAVMGDIAAFIDLSAEKYDVEIGGKKGNVSLISFDGKFKIQRAIQENISFDERLQAAKELIDGCIHRWSEGSGPELKVLVDDAFQVDKEGQISTGRVLGLRRHNIDDADWLQAMDAIADSIQVTGSKSYVRFYERTGEDQKWQPITLDIAAL